MATATRSRRVRTKKASTTAQQKIDKLEELKRLVDNIQSHQDLIADSTAQAKNLSEKAEAIMKDMGITAVEGERGSATFLPPAGRSTREFDKEAVYEALEHDTFLECVNILATKLKEHLSGKEIENLSTVVQPAPKPPVIKVKPVHGKG